MHIYPCHTEGVNSLRLTAFPARVSRVHRTRRKFTRARNTLSMLTPRPPTAHNDVWGHNTQICTPAAAPSSSAAPQTATTRTRGRENAPAGLYGCCWPGGAPGIIGRGGPGGGCIFHTLVFRSCLTLHFSASMSSVHVSAWTAVIALGPGLWDIRAAATKTSSRALLLISGWGEVSLFCRPDSYYSKSSRKVLFLHLQTTGRHLTQGWGVSSRALPSLAFCLRCCNREKHADIWCCIVKSKGAPRTATVHRRAVFVSRLISLPRLSWLRAPPWSPPGSPPRQRHPPPPPWRGFWWGAGEG